MILIATICIIALVAVMVVFGRIYESEYSSFAWLMSVVFVIAVFCMAIVLAFDWFAAEQKANIINREYGTAYTQKEIFYAEDVIDTIREIDRSRIEVNGSLFKED